MLLKNKRLIAIMALASFGQVACYNTYFIDKSELEKLESQVEQKEVVVVNGDCPDTSSASAEDGDQKTAYRSLELDGTQWAQAGEGEEATTASDATGAKEGAEDGESGRAGCEQVPVSTANPVNVVTQDGQNYRVTPFNFMMSEQQIVSPEYDLLLSLDEVEGGEVREFSTWKTIGLGASVTAVAVGTVVGIMLVAPESKGFAE